MLPINLYLLSKTTPLNDEEFNEYLNCITKSKRQIKVKSHERRDFYHLIEILSQNCDICNLDGFYYSYTIDQISKEFDLIKITNDSILNIEIKSTFTTEDKIKNQLTQNKHYLKNINNHVCSFTFIADTDCVYQLNDKNVLEKSDIKELMKTIAELKNFIKTDLDDIITPSHYLVSPFNDVDKFINDEYFLTNQQQEIKTEILNDISGKSNFKYYKILGDAGTGKTLLIYDIAKELTKKFKVCIVHSGQLNSGHLKLKTVLKNCDIMSAKEFQYCEYENYQVFIVDETQRLHKWQLEKLTKYIDNTNTKVIFSIGIDQLMQQNEIDSDINGKIDNLNNLRIFKLSNKIRTNHNLLSFIKNIINVTQIDKSANYEHIQIIYAPTEDDVNKLKVYLSTCNYQYISFTPSIRKPHHIDKFSSEINTHRVIGQEYDNVVMIMGNDFEYQNNLLYSTPHPNPNYLFNRLFYQGITRARLNLAIIVFNNPELYKQLIKIKENKH